MCVYQASRNFVSDFLSYAWLERKEKEGCSRGNAALERNLVIHFWKIYAPLSFHRRKDNKFFDAPMQGQISKFKLYCEV